MNDVIDYCKIFGAFDLIYEEIRLLLKDYDFLKEKMPDTFNLGMFQVNLKEYKMRIINNIEGYYIPKLEECNYHAVSFGVYNV